MAEHAMDIWAQIEPFIVKTQEYLKQTSVEAKIWAKKNHPWKNKTGKGEMSIDTAFGIEADGLSPWWTITNKEGWRETQNDGKSGVCQITIEHFIPIVQAGIQKIWSGE